MNYTKEQFDQIKENPILKQILAITGANIEDLIDNTYSDDTLKIEDDSDKWYPLSKEDIFVLVSLFKELYNECDRYTELGINIWETDLGYAMSDLISTLLEYIDEDLADAFDESDIYYNNVDDSVKIIMDYYE